MKKVNVVNKQGQSFGAIQEDPTEWITDCVANNYWGKPERWVRAKVEAPITESLDWIYPDEFYNDNDVLETKEQTSEVVQVSDEGLEYFPTETWVKLRADYTIEIEDYNPVPQSISPAQARMALNQLGLLTSVIQAVELSTEAVKIYWDYATEFRRDNQMLNDMAHSMGLNDSQLDDIFRLGATF